MPGRRRKAGAAPAVAPRRRVASAPPSLRVLSRGECEALLARNVVGRIAFAHRCHVDVSPANYVYSGGWLFARADRALRTAIRHNRWVAVEVAEIQGVSNWQSVVVRGSCYATSPTGIALSGVATAGGVAPLCERIPEMSREDQSVPIGTAIFRVHADEMIGPRSSRASRHRALPQRHRHRGSPPHRESKRLSRAELVVPATRDGDRRRDLRFSSGCRCTPHADASPPPHARRE